LCAVTLNAPSFTNTRLAVINSIDCVDDEWKGALRRQFACDLSESGVVLCVVCVCGQCWASQRYLSLLELEFAVDVDHPVNVLGLPRPLVDEQQKVRDGLGRLLQRFKVGLSLLRVLLQLLCAVRLAQLTASMRAERRTLNSSGYLHIRCSGAMR
jgi:hypothetical protein